MGVEKKYSNLDYNVKNFKAEVKVTVEFQVNFGYFKASKKIDIVKTYLFCLLKVYLVDNVNNEMSTSEKYCLKNNK